MAAPISISSRQFGEFLSKAADKQELRLGASRTNVLRQLKAVEPGHDNITHYKVDWALVLLAQTECLCAIGGSKDGEPGPFERPLQKVLKVVVVFDYQDCDGTRGGRCEVKS